MTWSNVLGGAVGTEVIFDPSNPDTVYAALGSSGGNALNGVYKSSDGGMTWSRLAGTGSNTLPTGVVGRIALAIAPSNPSVLYAGIPVSTSSSLSGFFKTTDGGQNWSRLATAPDYCRPQCDYNNSVRVHPSDPNYVVAGGVGLWRSTNGGSSWARFDVDPSGVNFVHNDHHALAFSTDGGVIYDGNDGGVVSRQPSTGPPVSWNNLNATLAITEFSSNIAIHQTDPNIAYAGTQDNGVLIYSGSQTWDVVTGGDGGLTAMDFAVPSIWYGEHQDGAFFKFSGVNSLSQNLFSELRYFRSLSMNGIDSSDRFRFYTSFVMDPSNPQRLYFGTNRLYQTNDGAGTWTAILPDVGAPAPFVTAIAVSPSTPSAVAVGAAGKVFVSNTADLGPKATWVDRTAGLPGRTVSHVAFDPINTSTFYVTLLQFSGFIPNDFGGHVFKTTNFGETWIDISKNLPNSPTYDIVVDPDIPNTLYLAGDIGVFQSSDGGETWSTLSDGLPRVPVLGMTLHRPTRTLRAVTRGRSAWDLSVPLDRPSRAPRIDLVSPAKITPGNAPVTILLTGLNFASGSVVRWNGTDRETTVVGATSLKAILSAADVSKTGRNTLMVFSRVEGGGLSNALNVEIGPPPTFTPSGVTSAASPSVSGPLVPGGIHSIFGSNLAPDIALPGPPPLPFTLGGVTVEVNGVPAALFYVSPAQITFQAPWELDGFNRVPFTIINGTLVSSTGVVNVVKAAPALFSVNGRGTGQGNILIDAPDSPIAAPTGAFAGSRPARAGETIRIYGTGLGSPSAIPLDGYLPFVPAISRTPVVTIGGVQATVSISELARQTVGLYRIDAVIPRE